MRTEKRFLELTKLDGNKIFIDIESIESISVNAGHVLLRFSSGHVESCKEDYDDVVIFVHRYRGSI